MSRMRVSGTMIVVVAFAMLPAHALAHGLSGQCRVRGGQVIVEAYYDTKDPVVDAKVSVANADGREVANGRTDEAGAWSFQHPGPGRFDVRIDAGAGHRHTLTITLHEPGADEGMSVSSGPSRDQYTSTRWRWVRIAIGLGTIAGASILLRGLLRRPATPTSPNAVQ